MKQTLTDSELSFFSGQLAMILHSGISTLEGISILKEDTQPEEGQQILSSIYEALEMTGDFAHSLRESGAFPEYFLKMTEIGEKSGTLEEVMESLSEYYHRQHTLFRSIRDALTYPLILLGMLLAVLIVLMTQVMPVFEEVFEQLGIEVVGITGTVFRIGAIMQKSAVSVLVLVVVIVLACILALKTEKGKASLLAFLQRIPFAANIFRLLACARFSNALSLALHSGLDMWESFTLASELTEQKQFKANLDRAGRLIEEGGDFGESLRESRVFTGLDARMVSIGFRTGASEAALQKISVNCQTEADNKIQSAINMLEPVLTVILAVLTGVILVSVMLPLLGVMANIG